jgi:predicted outer membrane repeat protein
LPSRRPPTRRTRRRSTVICTSTLAGNPCTLRAAVQAANFLGGGPHTINLTVAGTYALTVPGAGESAAATGDLNVTASVTIANTSGSGVVVDGTALNDRVFDVSPAAATQVAISGITIQNGTTTLLGGGIQVGANATLRLDTVTLTGNTAAQGGAIANSGTLMLSNTTLTNNAANNVGTGGGGGLLNQGTATLTNGTISSNEAVNPGGGIFKGGTATLTNVQVVGNVSEGNGGGGIENTGSATLTVTGGAISDNAVASASGGGLDNENGGTATLTNVTVHHNSAVGGGGVFNAGGAGFQGQAGTISLTNVTVSRRAAASASSRAAPSSCSIRSWPATRVAIVGNPHPAG